MIEPNQRWEVQPTAEEWAEMSAIERVTFNACGVFSRDMGTPVHSTERSGEGTQAPLPSLSALGKIAAEAYNNSTPQQTGWNEAAAAVEAAIDADQLMHLLGWAYGKLIRFSFASLDDCLAMDEIHLRLLGAWPRVDSERNSDAAVKNVAEALGQMEQK